MKGSDAVLAFGTCTNFDQVSLLVKNYDSNKFGLLDQFESCSHSFQSAANHGGHTALGCMQVLVNAMNGASGNDDDEEPESEFSDAIAALAELLYHNAGDFCECASKASADCPLCSSFIHVKTLLFESLDACKSLDEIDCDAWTEFQSPCKNNIIKEFGSVDFSTDATCKHLPSSLCDVCQCGLIFGTLMQCFSPIFLLLESFYCRYVRPRGMRWCWPIPCVPKIGLWRRDPKAILGFLQRLRSCLLEEWIGRKIPTSTHSFQQRRRCPRRIADGPPYSWQIITSANTA